MQKIKLTQDQYALVDNEDYTELSNYNWYASFDIDIKGYYATRVDYSKDKPERILMHRFVMNVLKGEYIDHKNHKTLDNRKQNLRICSCSQNAMNRKGCKNTSSKFKGVTWDKKSNKWHVQIFVKGKQKYLGLFELEIEGAKIYNKYAKKYFGNYVFLNDVKQEKVI
jgi:hypothetical protein